MQVVMFSRLLHLLLIFYIVLTPVLAPIQLIPSYMAFSSILMLHWITNENRCAWSNLEASLRGIPVEEGFIYRILEELFKFGQLDKDRSIKVINILIWSVTITMWIYSCIRMINSNSY